MIGEHMDLLNWDWQYRVKMLNHPYFIYVLLPRSKIFLNHLIVVLVCDFPGFYKVL